MERCAVLCLVGEDPETKARFANAVESEGEMGHYFNAIEVMRQVELHPMYYETKRKRVTQLIIEAICDLPEPAHTAIVVIFRDQVEEYRAAFPEMVCLGH